MIINEKDYKLGFVYYNKENQNLLVKTNTKRSALAVNGNVINFAHPVGMLMGCCLVLVSVAVVLLIALQLYDLL